MRRELVAVAPRRGAAARCPLTGGAAGPAAGQRRGPHVRRRPARRRRRWPPCSPRPAGCRRRSSRAVARHDRLGHAGRRRPCRPADFVRLRDAACSGTRRPTRSSSRSCGSPSRPPSTGRPTPRATSCWRGWPTLCLALADAGAAASAGGRARRWPGPRPPTSSSSALRELAGDDADLRWRGLVRLAELGRLDRAELEALHRRDPDPDAWVRALGARGGPARRRRPRRPPGRPAMVDRRSRWGRRPSSRRAFWQPVAGRASSRRTPSRYAESLPGAVAGRAC